MKRCQELDRSTEHKDAIVPNFEGAPFVVAGQDLVRFNEYMTTVEGYTVERAIAASYEDLQWNDWGFEKNLKSFHRSDLQDLRISFVSTEGLFELRDEHGTLFYKSETPTYKEALLAWCLLKGL